MLDHQIRDAALNGTLDINALDEPTRKQAIEVLVATIKQHESSKNSMAQRLNRQRDALARAELRVKNANERSRKSLTVRFVRNTNTKIRDLNRTIRKLTLELAEAQQAAAERDSE